MNKSNLCRQGLLVSLCGFLSTAVLAEPITFDIDSRHTFPSFAADHQSGFSIWRGKIRETSGTIVLDRESETGTVNVTMNMDTIDFGMDAMSDHARAPDILDVAQFPTATYTGTLTGFQDGNPTAVTGHLTMHGVTQPLDLEISRLQCRDREMREACGAEILGSLDRSDYGVDFGLGRHLMWVELQIQLEALERE